MKTLNLTSELERLITDIVSRMDEFNHIDPSRILVCVSSTRVGGVHGTYAKIHPLRFENGSRTKAIGRGMRRHVYESPTVTHRGVEMLYVIYFLVPRFLNLPFREKMITLFHELYHVSPEFDGDIRRFPGKNYAHGSSTRRYNNYMAQLVEAYFKSEKECYPADFLKGDMAEIRQRYRSIVGRKMAAPQIKLLK